MSRRGEAGWEVCGAKGAAGALGDAGEPRGTGRAPALSPASPGGAGGRSGFARAEGAARACVVAAPKACVELVRTELQHPAPHPESPCWGGDASGLAPEGLGQSLPSNARLLSAQTTALGHRGEKIKCKTYKLKPQS